MKTRTREQIEKDMQKLRDRCATWLTSKDGSHGACLHHGGMGELIKELEALEGKDNPQDPSGRLIDE